MIRKIYTFIFALLLPLVFLRLWIKGRKLPGYRQRWQERCGTPSFPPQAGSIWIHAVSVGEAISAVPLIKAMVNKGIGPIIITTTTPTGSERVQASLKNELNETVFHSYLPYDLPIFLNRFLKHCQPQLLIIMETEVWPNLICVPHAQKIPVMIANARLSGHSVAQYSKAKAFFANILAKLNWVVAQSQLDAKRYHELGVPNERILSFGNIKFDISATPETLQKGEKLRALIGENRSILIAASTHSGEEALVLKAFRQIKAKHPNLLLLLVPRHPDRFLEVNNLCLDERYQVVTRSSKKACTPDTDIFLGDSMGEMMTYYAASNIAFIGGSLVPIGGHNLLEPAVLGLPVITGPHLSNFLEISQLLKEANAVSVVQDIDELVAQIDNLLINHEQCQQMGNNARETVAQNGGAIEKLCDLIQKTLTMQGMQHGKETI